MKLARPTKRQAPEAIIALIDVVFFLLIFFMLIGRMDATAPFDLTPATSQTGSDMPGGGRTLAISAGAELALDGVELGQEALLEQMRRVLGDAPETLIRVNAHRDAELRFVLPLIAKLRDMGARDVMLVVTPEAP